MKEGEGLQWFKDEKSEKEFQNLPEIKTLFHDDARYDDLALEEMAKGVFVDQDGKTADGVMTAEFYKKNIADRFDRIARLMNVEEEHITQEYEALKQSPNQTIFDYLKNRQKEIDAKKLDLEVLRDVVDDKYQDFINNFSNSSPEISEDTLSLN